MSTAPTAKQMDFIHTLLGRRDPDNAAEDFLAFTEGVEAGDISRRDASEFIGALIKAHREDEAAARAKAAADLPQVPAGRYALPHEDEDAVSYYKVDRPQHGHWAGWTFVNRIHPVNGRQLAVKGQQRTQVLSRIAKDPNAAVIEYGKRTGTCGACGRTLTDPESIAAGIGPICAGKY